MSSLIFVTENDQAIIATDTLATSPGGEPAFFTTKAFHIPHLRMIIAGTGMSGLLGSWFLNVNDRMVVKGIRNLDFHAPELLRQNWSDLKESIGIPDDLTTTVYHFGFTEDDVIATYVYRSINDFETESLAYGIGIFVLAPEREWEDYENIFEAMLRGIEFSD